MSVNNCFRTQYNLQLLSAMKTNSTVVLEALKLLVSLHICHGFNAHLHPLTDLKSIILLPPCSLYGHMFFPIQDI
jgi:hypothetical protein